MSAEHHGARVIRHFGDPAAEYRAATSGVAVFDRSYRARLAVRGREPRQMLNGILTGTLPGPPEEVGDDVLAGRAHYSAVLTPKGKMVTDAWAVLRGEESSEGFLLDVPAAGAVPLRDHLRRFLPPRMAKVEDVSDELATITVVGPAAPHLLARLALATRVEGEELEGLDEGAWREVDLVGEDNVLVMATGEVWPPAFDVTGAREAVLALWRVLRVEDATPAGLSVWSTLRVEAGRPEFGVDMDDATIPVEAGIHRRGIDESKGCYTGQEVIVRIRDRGHVNRHLVQLRLGDVPAPAEGTELFGYGSGKPVGRVTSAVESPRLGGVVALAYVRRGVDRLTFAGREVEVPAVDDW